MTTTHSQFGKPRHMQRDPNRTWQTARATPEQVLAIRAMRWTQKLSYRQIREHVQLSHATIWQIANGNTWTHLPMPWERVA